MALYPQRIPQTQELLSAGYARCGTVQGELFRPDGSVLVLGAANVPKAAAVANASGTVTDAKFNELLTSLRNAGYLTP